MLNPFHNLQFLLTSLLPVARLVQSRDPEAVTPKYFYNRLNKGCQYLIRSPLVLGEDCQHQERDERDNFAFQKSKYGISKVNLIWEGQIGQMHLYPKTFFLQPLDY